MSQPQPDPRAAAARLKKLSRLRPTLAVVLGSGFQHVLSELRVEAKISYAKLPGFPPTTVSGHAGQLFIGHLGGTPVMVLERPGALLRGASDDAGDVRGARPGRVWHPGFAVDERRRAASTAGFARGISWC